MAGPRRAGRVAGAIGAVVAVVVAGGLVDARWAGAALDPGSAVTGPLDPGEGAGTPLPPAGDPVGQLTDEIERVTGDAGEAAGSVVNPTTTTSSTSTTSTSSTTTTTTAPPRTAPPPPAEETAEEPDDAGEKVPVAKQPFVEHALLLAPPVPDRPVDLPPDPVPLRTIADFVDVAPGPRSTAGVMDLLRGAGASPDDIRRVLAPFPVAGPARYSNDWGAPRHIPEPHPHQGTDIFASRGTPVIAPAAGTVSRVGRLTAVGGNSVWLSTPDGTYYYFSHLDGFVAGLAEGLQLDQGDILGFVGNTGNARGTPPHLHFEIHPGGGDPVPPVPYLDSWLEQAMARARALVGGQGAPVPTPAQPFGTAPPTPPLLSAPAAVASPAEGSPVAGFVTLGSLGVSVWMFRRRRRLVERLRARVRLPAPSWWPRRPDPARVRIDALEALLQARQPVGRRPGTKATTEVDLDAVAPDKTVAARRRGREKVAAGRR